MDSSEKKSHMKKEQTFKFRSEIPSGVDDFSLKESIKLSSSKGAFIYTMYLSNDTTVQQP